MTLKIKYLEHLSQNNDIKISFRTEVSEDFYTHPEMDEISFPVCPEEVVVLEPPVHNRKKMKVWV